LQPKPSLAWGRGGQGNILVLATPRSLRSRAGEALLVLTSLRSPREEEEEVVEGSSSRGEVEAARLVLTRPSSSSSIQAGAVMLVAGVERGARSSTHVVVVLRLCSLLPRRHPAL
jgi:hypothetical protein